MGILDAPLGDLLSIKLCPCSVLLAKAFSERKLRKGWFKNVQADIRLMKTKDVSEVPNSANQTKQMQSQPVSADESLIAMAIFAEFVSALGPLKAAVWLERFCDELKEECPPDLARVQDFAKFRANIHHICGRAGFIGFAALHTACLEFLETGGEEGEQAAAYQRVSSEAARVYPEIERRRAALG
ncbi:MAG: hypothetical protein ACK4GC_03525 [Paracoccaceae bacterium]